MLTASLSIVSRLSIIMVSPTKSFDSFGGNSDIFALHFHLFSGFDSQKVCLSLSTKVWDQISPELSNYFVSRNLSDMHRNEQKINYHFRGTTNIVR